MLDNALVFNSLQWFSKITSAVLIETVYLRDSHYFWNCCRFTPKDLVCTHQLNEAALKQTQFSNVNSQHYYEFVFSKIPTLCFVLPHLNDTTIFLWLFLHLCVKVLFVVLALQWESDGWWASKQSQPIKYCSTNIESGMESMQVNKIIESCTFP